MGMVTEGGAGPRRSADTTSSLLPVVCQVVKATLDEAHADLPVGEPADQRAEQLLRLADQTLRQVDLTDRQADREHGKGDILRHGA